jgi:hypothetical protein
MVDRELTRVIRRLVEDTVPPAPWLEDRVIAAVMTAVERPSALSRRPARLGLAAAAVAALAIAAMVVGVLVGSHLGTNTRQVPATQPAPSRDRAVVSYRALIDGDMSRVKFSFQQNSRCQTRATCARSLAQTRTAAEALLRDMSSARTPPSVSQAALRVEAAAQQFTVQLDTAIAAIQQPNSDYVSVSSVPTIHDLDLRVAAVDCWPAAPVEGDHGITCS